MRALKFNLEDYRLTESDLAKFTAREIERLNRMTPEQRSAYFEAEEARILREELMDKEWFKA